MTKDEKNNVRKAGQDAGFRQSAYDSNKQVNQYGNTIKHSGGNMTRVNDKPYYGSHDAINAINKKK